MLAYILLPLIGIGLIASLFDGSDDDDPVVVEPPLPEPEVLEIEGTDGDDSLTGTGGNDLIRGLDGDDELRGFGGNDTLLGGAGDDFEVGSDGDDSMQGNNGEDTLWGRDGDDRMSGGNENDTLRGDNGDDVLRGGNGDDAVIGGPGDDVLLGNQGNDRIDTGTGADQVFGGNGDDTITGNVDDTITGGAGEDLIRTLGIDVEGGGGVTVTDFNPAEDTLLLAASSGPAPSIDADDDSLSIRQAENGTDTNVSVDGVLLAVLLNTDAAALAADTSWLANVAEDQTPVTPPVVVPPTVTINGTTEDDTLTGTGAPDRISGDEGDDVIRGFGSNDTLNGDEGNDFLIGGAGDDDLNDQIGNDTLWGLSGDDNLEGGSGNDVLRGDPGNDVLSGGRGIDALFGGDGDDTLNGGNDNDVLETGDGADVANGDDGNDRIFGFERPGGPTTTLGADDTAADTLNGGNGNDTITANNGDEVTGGSGDDLIRVLGLDQIDDETQVRVVVTDFNPDEDTLVLVDRTGADVVFDAPATDDGPIDPDSVVQIRASSDGDSTEVIYGDVVIALLQGTDVDDLVGEEIWLANENAVVIAQLAAAPPIVVAS